MSQSHDNITAAKDNERTVGLFKTIFIWLAASLVIPTVMTGQMFIPDLSPTTAMEAILIASLLGCIALGAIAAIGTQTGFTTFVYARRVFGLSGSKAFAILNIVLLLGWGVIQGYLGGLALNKVLSNLFGFDNIVLTIILTQGVVLLITLQGHKGIEKVESIASSLMLVMALAVIYYLLDQNGLTAVKNIPLSDSPALSYSIVFDIVLATAFSWMALPCDYNRYCKSVKISVSGISIGYMVGTLIAMGLGILVGSISIINGLEPTYDPAAVLDSSFGTIAALVMFLSVMTTNVMVLYSITMSTMSLSSKFSFAKVALFFGLISSLASLLQELLMVAFFDWILLVGAFMIPVFSIMLVDYYILKNQDMKEDRLVNINIPALITVVISVLFSLYFTYSNPLEFGATAATFLFAGVLYFILVKVFSKKEQLSLEME